MRDRRRQPFGIGLSIGVALGLLLGWILVRQLGEESAEMMRSALERLFRRRQGIRFEALLQ